VDEIWAQLIDYSNYPDEIIDWRSLKSINRFTLLRIFEQTDILEQDLFYGFTFNQLKSIAKYALKDARNIGPGRLKQLVDELNYIFSQEFKKSTELNVNSKTTQPEPEYPGENIYSELINARTLAEFDKYFVESLQLFVFTKANELEVILHRAEWSHFSKQTLEEIGTRLGITRERVRQIESKQKHAAYPITDEIYILNLINHIFITSTSYEEYFEQFNDFEPTYYLNISPLRFVSLAIFLGKYSLAERLSNQIETWNLKQAELDSVKVSITKHRNQLGLIDLFSTSVSQGIGEESIYKIIKEVYPRSMRVNNLVLARTERLNTIFESTIYRQLLVSPTIPLIEVKVGLERIAKYRGQELIGHPSDVFELIERLAGNPCNKDKLQEHLVSAIKLSNHEQWLVSLFTESKMGILHRDEVTEAAIEDGVAIGSVNQYLSTSPILRPHSKGFYSLVNQKVAISDLNLCIEQFSNKSNPALHKLISEKGINYFHVTPNLALIASGALIANNQEKIFFGKSIYSVSCSCNQLSSNQKVRVTSDGFLIGLSSLLHHGIQKHSFGINSSLKMKIDNDQQLIQLEVD
jgi:transcriptional regulator with XRE-family HTH domain